jgi:hypothetical protein
MIKIFSRSRVVRAGSVVGIFTGMVYGRMKAEVGRIKFWLIPFILLPSSLILSN